MGLPSIAGGSIATFGGEVSNISNVGSNYLSDITDGWADVFTEKAADIFEKRTATRIFDSHQEIALQSIQGSEFPTFDENENLYGFTIFQFKRGLFGGGWSPVNVNTLLGFDLGSVASGLLGGDKIANTHSYFFNVHPSSISLSEPFATHLVPTQGGGVYAESQGSVLKQMTIAGTTGYRPSKTHTQTSDPSNVIPHSIDEPTGFVNFLKLRNLFRNYSDLKKTKSLAYKTYLIWYNNKEQEAWFFEPSDFTTNRDAASPFTYDYAISGTLIQKVNFSTVVNKINPDPTSIHWQVASMRRAASLVNGIVGKLVPGLGDDVIGDILSTTSSFLGLIDDVDNFVMSVVEAGAGIMGLVPLVTGTVAATGWELRRQLNSAFGFEGDADGRYEAIFGADPGAFGKSYAEFAWNTGLADLFTELDSSITSTINSVNKILSPAGIKQLRDASSKSAGKLSKNNLGKGRVNEEYLSDNSVNWAPFSAPSTNEDFESWVYGITKSPTAFDAVVLYNDLQYPYVTETPSYQNGFNKFLNPGDLVYLPLEVEYVEGDLNTLINPQKASTNTYEDVLGRDLRLIKKTQATTGVCEFNLSISPNGDLDLIGGKDNMRQAIDIKLNTERGELNLHPEFGIVPVVGHKGTRNITFNMHLSLYDTMLSDGRIKELTDTSVNVSGDKVSVKTKVHVIGHIPYIPLILTMG